MASGPGDMDSVRENESTSTDRALYDYSGLASESRLLTGPELLLIIVVILVVGTTAWLVLVLEISGSEANALYRLIRIIVLAVLGLATVLFTVLMTRTILNRQQALGLVRSFALTNERLESEIALRRRIEQVLRKNEAYVSSVMNAVVDAILTTDAGGTIETLNSQTEKLFGYEAKDLLGENLALLVSVPYRKRMIHQLENYRCQENSTLPGSTLDIMGRGKNGRTFPIELSIVEMKQNGEKKLVAVARDVSKHKRLEMKLLSLSAQDGLTGIANRRTFDQSLESEWSRAVRHELPLALLMIDIDYFKLYNDSLGHLAGDECLKKVAHIIQNMCHRPGDMVARFGGEEFVGLLPETSINGMLHIAARIRSAVERAGIVHPASTTAGVITVSVGAALLIPGKGQNSKTIISHADQALYQAKSSGRNKVVHYEENDSTTADKPPL